MPDHLANFTPNSLNYFYYIITLTMVVNKEVIIRDFTTATVHFPACKISTCKAKSGYK